MNTILVTGASGFIGRFLILDLLTKGERVYALLRRPEPQLKELQTWLAAHGLPEHSQLHAIQGDLSASDLAISAADWQQIRDVNVVYHSGAVMAWGLEIAAARQTNLLGATQLLRLAHQHLRLARFVQVSGFLVMLPNYLRDLGIDPAGRNTDWPAIYKAVGGYEASKLETHFAIRHLAAELGIPLTVIHPSLVIGHSQSGEISLTQDYAKTVGNLLQRKLPLVPRGAIPMIAVDELTAFMARIIDVPEAIGQEYVLASSDTRSLKDTLTVCAHTAHVPAPYGTLPMGVFKMLSRIGWLARMLDIEAETLSFIRSERPDLTQTRAMQQQLGLSLTPLTDTLQHTTRYLMAQRAAKNCAHPAGAGTRRAWSRSSV